MKRREFITACGLASVAPLAVGTQTASAAENKPKQLHELRKYTFASQEKLQAFCKFLGEATIPAMNRAGCKKIGAFTPMESEEQFVYVLVSHCCMESVVALNTKMLADEKYVKAAADVFAAAKKDPAYQRVESSLSLAFDDCPRVEVPNLNDTRVLQLRIYESHTAERAKKKVAMFNEGGEIALFRECGMPPVFFGETLVGELMPNLTYLLSFEDMEAKEKGWKTFIASPKWKALSSDPQYKDTVSRITNIMLRPIVGSQI
jgi:hypothetical protein